MKNVWLGNGGQGFRTGIADAEELGVMKKALILSAVLVGSVCEVSALTFFYNRQFENEPLPPGEVPWMTLELSGNEFTFTIPQTATAPLIKVYFTVEDPATVSLASGPAIIGGGLSADAYNLAFDFGLGGVTAGNYTVVVDGWDGHLIEPAGGYYSIAEFSNGTWVADVPAPVPDSGLTLALLGFGLVGLAQARRYLR